jgi:hypothetical protein
MDINHEPAETERKAKRLLIMKRVLEVLGWLTAVALFAFASHAVFAASGTWGVRHSRSGGALLPVVAQDERGTRQDAPAQVRSREHKTRGRADLGPASIMREARTIYIQPTEHLDKKYLEYKLGKYEELRDWNLSLVTDPSAADLVITFDKTALNYIFSITDPRTSRILTSGKCIAVNGRLAAEYLGREIIKKIKDVRASSERNSHEKRNRDAVEDDDAWSES